MGSVFMVKQKGMSFEYKLKSIGERMQPCLTPLRNKKKSQFFFWQQT